LAGIAIKDLLEAGVHFGHQTKRWNPKMKEFIFGERNGIYIIDLGKTVKRFTEAEEFVTNLAADGRTVLFVGTKRQAQDVIAEEAQRCGMFHVNQRWLGGLLTNFTTIQRSLARLRDLEAMVTDGRYDTLSKKEIARLEKEKKKLQRNLSLLATVCVWKPSLRNLVINGLIRLPLGGLYFLLYYFVKAYLVKTRIYPMKFSFLNTLRGIYESFVLEKFKHTEEMFTKDELRKV